MENKSQIRKQLQREKAVERRLRERLALAEANLALSLDRTKVLNKRLKTAPESPKFLF